MLGKGGGEEVVVFIISDVLFCVAFIKDFNFTILSCKISLIIQSASSLLSNGLPSLSKKSKFVWPFSDNNFLNFGKDSFSSILIEQKLVPFIYIIMSELLLFCPFTFNILSLRISVKVTSFSSLVSNGLPSLSKNEALPTLSFINSLMDCKLLLTSSFFWQIIF